MPTLPHGVRILVCTRPTDMRKSFDGLIALTRGLLGENLVSGNIFVFVNRKADYAKALYWSRGGFCLWAKRLQQGCFAQFDHATDCVTVTDTELWMWLDGIELSGVRRRKRFELPSAGRVLR